MKEAQSDRDGEIQRMTSYSQAFGKKPDRKGYEERLASVRAGIDKWYRTLAEPQPKQTHTAGIGQLIVRATAEVRER